MNKLQKLGSLINDPEVAKKRLKGFAWEVGNMLAVAGLGFLASNLDLVNLPPAVIAVLALILNQITKTMMAKV